MKMKSSLTNNLALKIVSVLFAIMLWALVVNVDDPVMSQTYTGVSVTVAHEELITNTGKTYQIKDNTGTISVTLSAKHSLLEKISASDIQATADMKELELNTMIPITVSVPKYSGRIVSYETEPKNLQITIEEMKKNKFPITIATSGSVRDGYVLGDMLANPETVEVSGPESIVNSISKVVSKINVSGLSEDASVSAELVMYDEDGNVVDQSLLTNNLGDSGASVDVTLMHSKEVALKFDTSNISTAGGYRISDITYEPKEVQVYATNGVLKHLDKIYIPAEAISASNISDKTEVVVDLTEYLPDGVALVDETANSVAVTISVEKDGTKSIDIPVGSIAVENGPSGFKASYGTVQAVTLEFTGSSSVLDGLTADDIKAYVDMADVSKAGTYSKEIKATLPKGCSLISGTKVNITLEQN